MNILRKSLTLLAASLFAAALPFPANAISDYRAADVARLSKKSPQEREFTQVLSSKLLHDGPCEWKMQQVGKVSVGPEALSSPAFDDSSWLPAAVPGTVLQSLVADGVYPDPYYGGAGELGKGLIPDLAHAGRDFYSYWFRTSFTALTPEDGEHYFLQFDGVNYHCEVWLNGRHLSSWTGMFWQEKADISEYIRPGERNYLAIKVLPVDQSGTLMPRSWGALNEWHNGGDGWIGRCVTMLMSVGWDFTFHDGIRDRNTGIWRDVKLFKTGSALLEYPFVRSELAHPGYDSSRETVSVEVRNNTLDDLPLRIEGEIEGTGISFSKDITLVRSEMREVIFTPEEFPQLVMQQPRLWWPRSKGEPNLYTLRIRAVAGGRTLDSLSMRFGVREVRADRATPDSSKTFYVNGKQVFIQGTNWIPEAMCRTSDERMYAEMRYTAQTGINMLRLWGGGITESDYFYSLCDEMGMLVWEEFWMTGDTRHPADREVYLKNVASAVKRTRCHPSLAFYVSSNESTFTQGAPELIERLDGTLPYQHQSECDGIHDGSPYKQVNPMSYYENTASERGSRIDGFNPEYGAPCLPTVECLREMMDEKDLWPINKPLWDYLDGNGFDKMTTLYKEMTDQYGESSSIDEYAERAQFVGAVNYRGIAEVWRYNVLNSGDRFCSGYLYWYHNSPIPQVQGRMWDWSLEPTAALFAMQNATESVHPQFDFLKNTVSVANDLPEAFPGCSISVELYDLQTKKVWSVRKKVDVPAEATACDVVTVPFPEDITPVHFLKLRLFGPDGEQIGSNFYWRSNDKYLGAKTVSGPCSAGFQAINQLPVVKLRAKASVSTAENCENVVTVSLRNNSRSLAFFTRLQWLDPDGKPIRPSYYSDNFFSLLPSESKTVTISNLPSDLPSGRCTLVIGGFHQKEQRFTFDL